ncbi:DUF2304 family protein [Nanoarchaeota archaeon]
MFGVQILGIVFALVMVYLTYMYFKRKEFDLNDAILWLVVWLLFLILVIFPETVNIFLEKLQVATAIQLFMILGTLFLIIVVFYLYRNLRVMQKKMEMVVQKVALEPVKKKK